MSLPPKQAAMQAEGRLPLGNSSRGCLKYDRWRGETPSPMADAATMTGRTSGLPRGVEDAAADEFDQIFGSLAVRHGIKFGLAGVLSVFIALCLRLPEPTWALITAFVIMLAQFVGAVAEKSVMRVIGTAAGGVIGYLLTAGLEQQPVLYLLLVGGVVGFGTAMFGYYQISLCVPALRADHDGRREQRDERSQLSPGGRPLRESRKSASE